MSTVIGMRPETDRHAQVFEALDEASCAVERAGRAVARLGICHAIRGAHSNQELLKPFVAVPALDRRGTGA